MLEKLKYKVRVLIDEISAAMKFHNANRISKKNQNSKIRVGFIVQVPEIWDKEVDVFMNMNNRNDFNTLLLVVPPFSFISWKQSVDYSNNYFLNNYDNAIQAVNSDGSVIDVKELRLDYIFYQRPYIDYLPLELRPSEIAGIAKTCYIPYAYNGADNFLGHITNCDFFKDIYFSFFDSDEVCDLAKRKFSVFRDIGIHKFRSLGYPALENYEISCPETYKRIMWTPRWCFTDEIIPSNFMQFKDVFLDVAEKYKNITFVFRPHQLMFDEIIKSNIMTDDEIDEYLKKLNKLGVIYDHDTMVDEALSATDILVTDFSSIIMNYFLSGKPMIYCYREEANLNSVFQTIIDNSYVASTSEELEKHLENLLNGNDVLKDKRIALVKDFSEIHRGSASRIVDEIEKDYNN